VNAYVPLNAVCTACGTKYHSCEECGTTTDGRCATCLFLGDAPDSWPGVSE
jgi:hypothetical protein